MADTETYQNRFGLGLRPKHYPLVLKGRTSASWFEVISENFIGDEILGNGGRPFFILEEVRKRFPIALHGVSLSIGSSDPLRKDYLLRLKTLIERVDPLFVSDHLCWTGVQGQSVHDLLPLPYTRETLGHIIRRIDEVQNYFKRPILIENVSSYLEFEQSEISEWEFLASCANQSGCDLLLDINNIYVSANNHGFDPKAYIDAIPKNKIRQIHLAGHSEVKDFENKSFFIDTHDAPVRKEVWDLYSYTIQTKGLPYVMIERDGNIPSLAKLELELKKAQSIAVNALGSDPIRSTKQQQEEVLFA